MKFMDRLSRLLGRRPEGQIDSESDPVGRAEMPHIADGHLDVLPSFTKIPVLSSPTPDKESPLHLETRGADFASGDPVTRTSPSPREGRFDGQEAEDIPVSESHSVATENLPLSGKSHGETREEVNPEAMRYTDTPETAHKSSGLGSQEVFQQKSRKEVLGSGSDTEPNEIPFEENTDSKTIHLMVKPAGQPPVEAIRITCPSCSACYEIERSFIPETGRDLECSECGNSWFQVPEIKDDLTILATGDTDQSREIDRVSLVDCTDSVGAYGSRREHSTQDHLTPSEIRQIIEARQDGMHEFVASHRFHAIDPKGDTPLHLAARMGNLALCDLFIRSGADPSALNHERRSPADVAHAEGHKLASQLLSSLTTSQEIASLDAHEKSPIPETTADMIEAIPQTHLSVVNDIEPDDVGRHRQERSTETSWTDDRVELLKGMWSEGRSANQISRELGGVSRNAVLSKALRLGLWKKAGAETSSSETTSEVPPNFAAQSSAGPEQQPSPEIAQTAPAPNQLDDLDDLLGFEAEEEPEEFFGESSSETVSGTFVALVSPAPVVSDDEGGDWDLDLSSASIAGEGIGAAAVTTDHGAEHDFLKVRNRGRQSVKRTVVQTGTRLSIDPEICIIWAEGILAKGWCSFHDVDGLVANCEGNGDLEELRNNLQRNLEAAGFDIDQANGHDAGLWDARSDVSSDDLADVIEATLTRATRLPGTQRFVMGKSDELQLLEPMMRAKQELQLGILASETAVETILDVIDGIRDGSRDPGSVSLRTIIPARPGHAETSEVMAAADTLRSWHTTGRVMDGKRRREALAALEALDLSLAFHKELVRTLEQLPACQAEASQLEAEILVSESTTENLIREHLPYVRRFASRNVEEGEDPEDVFQVAFMGLQRSTKRFDPERGYRFLIYATYWMRQAIKRWRADEGTAIRIPVHRTEKITKLDRALDWMDVRVGGTVSDLELAEELEWTIDEVRQFRGIPREAEYPASIDDWDNLLPEPSEADVFDRAETERIVTDALAELPERQADVIRMRFGFGRDSEMTLEEIGQLYGVTRERIRQIEAKGLDRLSHPGRKKSLSISLGYPVGIGQISFAPEKQQDGKSGNTSAEKEVDKKSKQARTATQLSEHQIDILRKSWKNGKPLSAIAQELGGLSLNEVKAELKQRGLWRKVIYKTVRGRKDGR